MMTKWIFMSILAAVLAGCVGSPKIPFEGNTSADRQLSRDVYERVAFYTEVQDCDEIEKVKIEIIEYPRGKVGERRAEERWEVIGCGKRYPFEIIFTDDGEGGTYFSVGSAGKE